MKTTYGEARAAAVLRELDANPEILLIGSGIAHPFNPDIGIDERYPDRVIWPPIAEFATLSIGVGAAMAGLRTVVPIGTSTFMYYGWSALVQEAANVRYLSGGQTTAPVTFHIQGGFRRGAGVQHEQTPHAMLQNVPGLVIYAPGTPAEVDSVFHAALTGDDPTLIADHVLLVDAEGEVTDTLLPLDKPNLVREGSDLLIVTYSLMVERALQAAKKLEEEGISAAVLSTPRLAPAPIEAIVEVAQRYEYVLFVDESRGPGSPTSYFMARLFESGATPRVHLTCTADAQAPVATHLLDEIVPTAERIQTDARALVGSVARPRS